MESFTRVNEKDKYIEELEKKIFELKSVISEVPGNIYWKSKDGKYLGCNKDVITALNRVRLNLPLESPEDIIGKNNFDVFADEILAESLTANDNLVMSLSSVQVFIESHSNNLNQKQFWLSKKAPLHDSDGNVVGLIGAALDITKQKKLEQELESALNKSMSDVRAKEAFIDSLSHDIRTPLTGIIGLIDSINIGTKSLPEVNKKTILLKNAALSFLDFFNEILATVEDIDLEESQNEESLVDVNDLLKEFENLFKPAFIDKNIQFITKVDPQVPNYIIARKHIIVRIMTNLISNSIKFTPKGYIEVSINCAKKKNHIEIIVKDTGIGIAKKNQDKIFDRFSKVNSRKTKYKGSGLGLFMVEKYISALDGDIKLDSKVGKGSTFYITLPAKYSSSSLNVREVSNYISITDEEYAACVSISKKRILIVEDNNLAAFALSNIVEEFKHDVDIVDSGAKTLSALQSKQYDLIYLDQDLPDVNGIDLLESIRALASYTNTPIFIISGHINKATQKKVSTQKCQGLFVKPMHREQVIKIFNKYLAD